MSNLQSDQFYRDNPHALRPVEFDVREHLADLALETLKARFNLASMSDADILREFYLLISSFHQEYNSLL